MPEPEDLRVELHGTTVGTLYRKGDLTWFSFSSDYLDDPDRPVLGIRLDQSTKKDLRSSVKLPAWFSNLLPEGLLRTWVAQQRGVSEKREAELLTELGLDLPGAVVISPVKSATESAAPPDQDLPTASPGAAPHFKFSLAGVAMKFSMVQRGDRLTLPARAQEGSWIVKLPDPKFPQVPRNEFAMMSLAAAVGIEVPQIQLRHRDEIDHIPGDLWNSGEDTAYTIKRFDRSGDSRIHIEDLAQVRGFYPDDKYKGNFETLANLILSIAGADSLAEFTRRLAFNFVIGNGDAHLKNWSFIYRNPIAPVLSPAYDVVATAPYLESSGGFEDLGLKFGRSRRFSQVSRNSFNRLATELGITDMPLEDIAATTAEETLSRWPEFENVLVEGSAPLARGVGTGIHRRAAQLLGKKLE